MAGRGRNFYLWIGGAVAFIVSVGFGRTIDAALFHPPSRRPAILYIHAAMFTSWVLLFIAQAVLVRSRRIEWHRRLGAMGVTLGCFMPLVAIQTALTMTRLHMAEGDRSQERALILPFFDMLAFSVTLALAAYWRRKPEYHRRVMLMATCGLTVAAFARFPHWLMPHALWYLGVDLLIAAAAVRDWLLMRRVHPVYSYGMPALALGQAATMWIYLAASPTWLAIADRLLR